MIANSKSVVLDLMQGAKKWHLWMFLARDDLLSSYRRTMLGFLWEPLSYIIVVVALGPLYAKLMQVNTVDYIVYFAAGWLAWRFVAGLITASNGTYMNSERIIRQLKLPYSLYSYKQIVSNFYIFLLNVPVFLLIVIYTGDFSKIQLAPLLLGIFIYLFTGFFLSISFGYVSLVYRDFRSVIDNIMRIAFFVTPVIWGFGMNSADSNALNWAAKSAYINYNPLYHYLVLVREPMLGNPVPDNSYLISLGISSFFVLLGLYVLMAKRRKIAFMVL